MTTTVRFLEEHGKGLTIVEVEASARELMLARLARALFDIRVQVLPEQSRRSARVDRVRIADQDGGGFSDERRAQVQAAVLAAIEGMVHATAASA